MQRLLLHHRRYFGRLLLPSPPPPSSAVRPFSSTPTDTNITRSIAASTPLRRLLSSTHGGESSSPSPSSLEIPASSRESEEQDEVQNETEVSEQSSESNLVLGKLSNYGKDIQNDESASSGAYCKIGIIVKSFHKPKYMGAFGAAAEKNRVKLPTTRSLITVLQSPHIDKKSREQYEIKVRKEYMVIKCKPHELRKKYFWFKRTRILGAQFELVFSYKTRLDMSRLKQSV